MKKFNLFLSMAMIAMLGFFTACEKDENDEPDVPNPFADFDYEVSEENPLQVSFTNKSTNSETYMWDFGDGNTSTEENPTHEFAEAGAYDVVLTATNSADVSTNVTKTVDLVESTMLAGDNSKTWKLYREGISMSFGPSAEDQSWWPGLENDGSRPCVYYHEFTFTADGTFEFNDNGVFWGEFGVWDPESDLYETCFEAIPENMVNVNGDDVSEWLSGSYEYTYDREGGSVTLNGLGAWIGIPKLGTSGETLVPVESVTFDVTFTENAGYDLMTVGFDYGDAGYWKITYASYSDPSLEPDVVVEEEPFGDDLEDITPTEIYASFASQDAADLVTIDTVASGSTVQFGVEDPMDASALVGEFTRTEGVQYQELMFRASPEPKDIQFNNFTTVSIDVFVPADTDFDGTDLQKHMVFGFGDMSETEQWWTDIEQYEVAGDDFVVGAWTTYTFNLGDTEVLTRNDLDMIYLGLGGGGHSAGGTFYIRNLTFE